MIEDLLELEKCNCGREYCQFFSAGMGESGSSFSRKELLKIRRELPKLKKHLDKLLK